jgi:adenylosuccinate lyase
MNRLIEAGMDRSRAYSFVQEASFRAVEEEVDLKEIVLHDAHVLKYLKGKEIEKIFNLQWYVRNIV